MFEEYPVVTNESLKLKMDTLGQIPTDSEELNNGLNSHQCLFSQLLTSINPFAQFIMREMVTPNEGDDKHWILDEKIL